MSDAYRSSTGSLLYAPLYNNVQQPVRLRDTPCVFEMTPALSNTEFSPSARMSGQSRPSTSHQTFSQYEQPSSEAPSNPPAASMSQLQSTTHNGQTNKSQAHSRAVSGQENDLHEDLPALQVHDNLDEADSLEPIDDDDPASYDLVAPPVGEKEEYSLEKRSQSLFSRGHLQVIFADPSLLFRFTAFLSAFRPQSVPILVYYLDALKALRAIHYANAVCDGLDPVHGFDVTSERPLASVNASLEHKANEVFDVLVKEELPAYITHVYIQIVSLSISRRVTGSLAPHLQAASQGLAEVFCLTDPSRPDNPIVFASEEFHRTTQYGMSYVLGRNCRFLQGPFTNPLSVRRLRDAMEAGRQTQEVFLNYRRDGSPFMNLLMTAPLCDSRGKIRYFIGAQVDVSGLVKECTELESLQRLLELEENGVEPPQNHKPSPDKDDELRELSEMLNQGELSTIQKYGGRMHRETVQDDGDTASIISHQPRLLIKDPETIHMAGGEKASGKLGGVYKHYLLVRPYPSLRILFASPSQRMPGILQSPFMDKIGGSDRVRDELTAALAEGRGVTAKVRWVSKSDENGRSRWIHCTPLMGGNGQIGVWMVVIIDDEQELRRWKQAPPVPPTPPRGPIPNWGRTGRLRTKTVTEDDRYQSRAGSQYRNGYGGSSNGSREGSPRSTNRSESLTSLRIG